MTQDTEEIFTRYKTYLKLERSFSANTLDAYQRDLEKLTLYAEQNHLDIRKLTYEDLQHFIAGLHDQKIQARSVARILSGVKSFYRFLLLDGYIESDPSELVEVPKIGLKLPDVLSVNEIDRILATIDVSTTEGQRNRAMLEVLYSCGLRVSELISLHISDIYPDEEFIRVEGKGSKQRLVPISQTALREIKNYVYLRGFMTPKKGAEDRYSSSSSNKPNWQVSIRKSVRTLSAIPLPHTFWKAEQTCAPSKRCWDTRILLRPKSIRISTGSSSAKRFWSIIRVIIGRSESSISIYSSGPPPLRLICWRNLPVLSNTNNFSSCMPWVERI